MEGEQLYWRSYLGPLKKCVDKADGNYVIREIHEGIRGMHAGPKAVVAKAMKASFFWPGMYNASLEVIRKCDNCQLHAPVPS
jgi:hypothetical protein